MKSDHEGATKVGDGTKMSCDRAIELASQDITNSIIIATAGNAGRKWREPIMSACMATYIRQSNPQITIFEACAESFDTFGEMKKLAQIVTSMEDIEMVTLAVKNWHAPRVKFLFRFWQRKCGCVHIPVKVSTFPQPVPVPVLLREYFGAWPKNIVRVACHI